MAFAIVMLLALAGCDACKQVTGNCCKTCTDSKPCGDSCIARNQTCSKSGGCACVTAGESLIGED